jgi:8-oxo-dGTP diphosphatase
MTEERPKVGVAVMVEKSGKILMGKRKKAPGQGTWALPGGHVEFGERLIDAAAREIKEEAGLDVYDLELISVADDISYGKHFVSVTFKASAAKGEPSIKSVDEFSEMGWFGIEHLPDPVFDPLKNVLGNYLSKKVYGGGTFDG